MLVGGTLSSRMLTGLSSARTMSGLAREVLMLVGAGRESDSQLW